MAGEYEVRDVNSRMSLTDGGRFEKVYEVVFVTKLGVRDVVEFKEADYTAENVKKILIEKTKLHDMIKGA